LHRDVATGLERVGHSLDARPHAPHITLARARPRTGDPALAARTLAQQAGVDDDIALNSIIAASVGQKDRRIYIGNLPAGAQPEIIKEFT
jgi:2'-5' RNA ligase